LDDKYFLALGSLTDYLIESNIDNNTMIELIMDFKVLYIMINNDEVPANHSTLNALAFNDFNFSVLKPWAEHFLIEGVTDEISN
jgi:hypothetical protein